MLEKCIRVLCVGGMSRKCQIDLAAISQSDMRHTAARIGRDMGTTWVHLGAKRTLDMYL